MKKYLLVFTLLLLTAACGDLNEGTLRTSAAEPCAPWDAGTVYLGGDTATFEEVTYKAKWWTQGQNPAQNSTRWAVWEVTDACEVTEPDPNPNPEPDPNPEPEPDPNPNTGDYVRVGYFVQWGIYARDFTLADMDRNGAAETLTHLNYAFGGITPEGECTVTYQGKSDSFADYGKAFPAEDSVDGVGDVWDQPLKGNFNQLKELKAKYPGLRTLISLGGWTWSDFFSDVALTDASHARSSSAVASTSTLKATCPKETVQAVPARRQACSTASTSTGSTPPPRATRATSCAPKTPATSRCS